MESRKSEDPGSVDREDSSPPQSRSVDHELDELLEEFVERQRRGENPTIDEYAARRPDLAADIRMLFPAMRAMEELVKPLNRDTDALRQIGEFRILREAGRGGMGVVYEALQESLGRRVALKVLPRELSNDAKGLERFRREARAAAKLHHTNIVPVFDVGEEGGFHYYAMQYIDGRGLDLILDEARRMRRRGVAVFPALDGSSGEIPVGSKDGGGSSWTNTPERRHQHAAARIALQVADALAYAHAQKVLHRDVKPSNLLLDAHGTVWITDFGLAKAQDAESISSGGKLTEAGDIVGTIAYLAPERLEGKSDERSDVYALGLTLHELLTLEPAFQDENRRRLLRRVAEESPVPPRQIDPSLPRDLETIVLTATAREPLQRYSSAARMADDLRNFLEGRPIAARRASSIERLGRWCRREPALAALCTLTIVLLLTIALISSMGYLKLSELLGAANSNLHRAQTAEGQARIDLRRSYVVQAHASRITGQPGRRLDCLDAARRAVALGPTSEEIDALRDDCIAALALADLRVTQRWRKEPHVAIAMAPDLASYALADPGGTEVVLRRISDQAEIGRLPVRGAVLGSLQFSDDGRFIAARLEGVRDRLAVLEVSSRRQIYSSSIYTRGNGLDFDARSRWLAFASYEDSGVHLVDLENGQELAHYPGEKDFIILRFNPSGELLAAASDTDKRILILEPRTGNIVHSIQDRHVHASLDWSRDGRLIAAGCGDCFLTVWEVRGGTIQERHSLSKAVVDNPLVQTRFNQSGSLLATYSWDPVFNLWDPRSGTLLITADYEPLVFSPDDRRMGVVTSTFEAGLVEVVESEVCKVLEPSPAARGNVLRQHVSPDGRLLVVARKDGVVVFDVEAELHLPPIPVARGRTALFSPDGQWLFTGGGPGLQRWRIIRDSEKEKTEAASEGGHDPSHGTHFWLPETLVQVKGKNSRWISQSADGKTLAILGEPERGEVVVLAMHGNERRRTVLFPHYNVDRISLSPDGKHLASGTWLGSNVTVWNTETGQVEHTIPLRDNASVEYSPDGRWLAVMTPEACFLRDAVTMEVRKRIEKPARAGYPGVAAFSGDGKLLAISFRTNAILLLDAGTGTKLAVLESPFLIAGALAFRPDGSHLYASTMTWSILDWDLEALRGELREIGLDWNEPGR